MIVYHQLHAPFSYLLGVKENLLNPEKYGAKRLTGRPDDLPISTRFEHRSRPDELDLDLIQFDSKSALP